MNEDKITSDTSFANSINLIKAQLAQITETASRNSLGDIPDTLAEHQTVLEKL